MSLLAIDVSTKKTGLALYNATGVLYEAVWESPDFHSKDLVPGIQWALKQTGLKMKDLRAVAVAIGPGSYTGLRIGLAVAKGLAFANGLALVAVPTLDILAAAQPVQDLSLLVVLQAGRGRLVVGEYQAKKGSWVANGNPALMTVQQVSDLIHKPTIICGELKESDRAALARKYKNALLTSPAWSLRRPAFLAELGWRRWQVGDVDETAGLAPVYLQASQAVPT